MEPAKSGSKYLKGLLVILGAVIVIGGVSLAYGFSKGWAFFPKALPSPGSSAVLTPTPTISPSGCTPPVLSEEERAILDQTVNNASYHFSYKLPSEWRAAISNSDTYASFADFVFGEELAAINFIMLVGNDDVSDFPVGDLVEESSRDIFIGPDCVPATYKVYEKTFNERWEKDEYHIRTTFTKDGVPYLVILNYPFQGASADGDTVDAYNSALKTIDFE